MDNFYHTIHDINILSIMDRNDGIIADIIMDTLKITIQDSKNGENNADLAKINAYLMMDNADVAIHDRIYP